MRRLGLVSLAISIWAIATPAQAQTYGNTRYPICLQMFGRFAQMECKYDTIDQCRASAGGLSATCVTNPYYTGAPDPRVRSRPQRGY